MPTKTWVVGEEVLAPDFNTYVQKQVVPTFATVAARNAAYPAATAGAGAACAVGPAMFISDGTVWFEPGASQPFALAQTLNIAGAVILNGSGFTFPSLKRRYRVDLTANVFKGGAAGSVGFVPSVAGRTFTRYIVGMNTSPLSSFASLSWLVEPGTNGGGIAADASPGSANVDSGTVIVTDVGGLYT